MDNIQEVSSTSPCWGDDTVLTTDSTMALPRMHDARYRMAERGIRAEPLQPEWCALRPGE